MPDYPAELPDLIRLEAAEDIVATASGPVPAAALVYESSLGGWFQLNGFSFEVRSADVRSLLGDVILVGRQRSVGERLIRRASDHNTLLITERCDQVCVMCSQPPKDYELDLFKQYQAALVHAGPDATIGISGGEPLLYKQQVFELIAETARVRPDLGFHVLTNAQHLYDEDIPTLSLLPHDRLRFAVPLYAADPELHDQIVGKPGAFARALSGILVLMEAGAEVEIRTVLMRPNAEALRDLAQFLAWTIPDITHWAIMQMEYIGFARKNWSELFFDHSLDDAPLRAALTVARQHGIPAVLYNMPLCTIGPDLRPHAPPTISDWKQKFFEECSGCTASTDCSGFFAWQTRDKTFRHFGPLHSPSMDVPCASS